MLELWQRIRARFATRPAHLVRGSSGERAAKKFLQKTGLKFLAANYRTPHGEIDLIFRDGTQLVFVEVKTRGEGQWTRPASAVNAAKRRRLSRCAMAYLRLVKFPEVPIRFDIVEVIVRDDGTQEIRHLPNTFSLSRPYRYG
jgi:putative endonuclease